MTQNRPTIDAHLHLWDLKRGRYRWLTPEAGPLYTTFTPAQAEAELASAGVDGALLIQADDSIDETTALLDLARTHAWVCGVVGWVQLDDPRLATAQLDAVGQHVTFKGVRHLTHVDPREDFLLRPDVQQSLRQVQRRGLTLDIPDAFPRQLGQIADLASACPGLVIIVDHLGKPPSGDQDLERWHSELARIAETDNTYVKVSGLRSQDRPYNLKSLMPIWDTALKLFTPHRMMWGSDWPIPDGVGSYGPTVETLFALIDTLSPAERRQVEYETAVRVYDLHTPLN